MLSQTKFYATFLSFLLCCAAANLLGQPGGDPSRRKWPACRSKVQVQGSGFQVFDGDVPSKQVGSLIRASPKISTLVQISHKRGRVDLVRFGLSNNRTRRTRP